MDAKRNDLLTAFHEKMMLLNTVESSFLDLFAEGLERKAVLAEATPAVKPYEAIRDDFSWGERARYSSNRA